jgi:hypothetical protein
MFLLYRAKRRRKKRPFTAIPRMTAWFLKQCEKEQACAIRAAYAVAKYNQSWQLAKE